MKTSNMPHVSTMADWKTNVEKVAITLTLDDGYIYILSSTNIDDLKVNDREYVLMHGFKYDKKQCRNADLSYACT